MSRNKYLLLIGFLIGVLLLSAIAPSKKIYTLSNNHVVMINGTSNLHDWVEQAGKVTGNASGIINKDKSFDLVEVNIKAEVYAIKSTKGSVMDNNTYKALKADKNPYIIYTLKQPVKSILLDSENKTILTNGRLTIAGVTRDANMLVKLVMLNSGKLTFEGSHVLQMTDYGIEPPTALLGTLKTGNEITITFKSDFIAIIKK